MERLKKKIWLIVLVLIGAVVSYQAFQIYSSMRDAIQFSTFIRPVQFALNEISTDIENGHYERAHRKVAILKARWDAYSLHFGRTHSCFTTLHHEILSENRKTSPQLEEADKKDIGDGF